MEHINLHINFLVSGNSIFSLFLFCFIFCVFLHLFLPNIVLPLSTFSDNRIYLILLTCYNSLIIFFLNFLIKQWCQSCLSLRFLSSKHRKIFLFILLVLISASSIIHIMFLKTVKDDAMFKKYMHNCHAFTIHFTSISRKLRKRLESKIFL